MVLSFLQCNRFIILRSILTHFSHTKYNQILKSAVSSYSRYNRILFKLDYIETLSSREVRLGAIKDEAEGKSVQVCSLTPFKQQLSFLVMLEFCVYVF